MSCPADRIQPITRIEICVLLLITLLACLLRCWDLSAIAVEHFDEGVYASNLWFTAEEGYRYPDRHLYAPPLLPTLIEWSLLTLGLDSWIPAFPSLTAGICSVPLIWWFGRKLAGANCGLAAAICLATNDIHILYSRTALTEALLCFLMLLSVSLAHCVCLEKNDAALLTKRSLWLAILSGVMAGLAWLTKYNGWLSLAVILSGTIAWGLFARFPFRQWKWLLTHHGIILAFAALIWLPYYFSLEQYGGYAAVSQNHRQYFVGVPGWGSSLVRQIGNQWALLSLTSLAGLLGAGVIALGQVLPTKEEFSENSWLSPSGLWMLASWMLGLSVAIPLYHAYPRLVVPWWIAVCLLPGVLMVVISRNITTGISLKGRSRQVAVPVTALAVILISFAGPLGNAPAWEKRTELLDVASKFVAVGGELAQKAGFPANRVVFYVYGEPAIFYHISAQNRLAGPIGHLKFAEPEAETVPTPVFLITGPHAKNSELFHEQWEKRGDAFIEVTSIETDASLFVELNETSRDEADPSREYVLYQLQNSASCP